MSSEHKASMQDATVSSPKGLHWYHWTVIFLSLLLTFSAFYIAERQVELKAKTQFDFQSQQIIELVQERMVRYEEALRAGVAALKMFPEPVSRQDWRKFKETIQIDERFPGINGIGVIHYVPPAKMPPYLAWQKRTMPEYKVHPSHSKSEYWPITYIEPQSTNLKAVGLDMAHENNRYTAAVRARTTNEANITAPIILVQDDQKTPGFLFYVPWFDHKRPTPFYGDEQDGFAGLVYAPFIMHKLMDGTLENSNRLIHFSIHDGDQLLYSELEDSSTNIDLNPLYQKSITLHLYGRPWTFNLQTTELFRSQQSHAQPITILIGGLIIDVMLLAIFMLLARSNRNAVAYANQVTASLKERNQELENVSHTLENRNQELLEANSELDQFAFVASHDLKAPLRGISQLATWIREDSEDSLPEGTHDHLELMTNRISRLERLLDDLLAYSRVGRNDGDTSIVMLEPFIQDVFNLLNHEEQFTLDVSIENTVVQTHVTPLELVLRNLMSNAMKHHHKGTGEITVIAMEDGDHIHFEIADDGPGIPVEHQEKVYELFHTLKPRDKVEGSGLGLSMIKKVLDRYNSTYHMKINENGGLTFVFSWPIELSFKDEDNA